jgi:hypothetical protein
METREAILLFQYAEKMKAGLIIGISLLNQLPSLQDEEMCGGVKVLLWYLEGLLREVQMAVHVLGADSLQNLEQKTSELIGKIERSEFDDAERSFSEAISLATTSCQRSMSVLVERKLI